MTLSLPILPIFAIRKNLPTSPLPNFDAVALELF